ncbi:hypothetical protein VAR608DRAFT_5547 [Variovorax sp. HW608]|uniref:BPSL0761 family protein n=1 Tax=Variovorax sp. HW608 TaxID=1034889 RepID=UPI00081F9164|nr:BPSL0761 family protein [Variovorax sp. HW608]SCK54355.1 hypothetical protein VAR608DRAFT_5547 [Variovorax sp. HW608]
MTVGYERRRALEWAGELLRDLAFQPEKHEALWGGPIPPKLKLLAHRILRHYPEPWQLDAAVESDDPVCWWISKEPPR